MYKSCNVVMLSTNEKANGCLGQVKKVMSDRKIGDLDYFRSSMLFSSEYYNPKHLYIKNNDEIKKRDWWLNKDDNSLNNDDSIAYLANNAPSCKKIIATSNTKITSDYSTSGTAFIPQQFIEYYVSEYNQGNVITEVMVEFEQISKGFINALIGNHNYDYKLLITQDNTINIKPVKNSYSRDELIIILNKFCGKVYSEYTRNQTIEDFTDNWVEQNL